MLKIETEFRHGIFFIRLIGSLTKKTVKILDDNVTNLILKNGFKNVVFNVEKLHNIDIKGISKLLYNYEITRNNHGNIMMCGINDEIIRKKIVNSRLLKYVKEVNNELVALQTINV